MGSQRWFTRYRRTHREVYSGRRPLLEHLEPRLLLSADPGSAAFLPAFESPVGESALSLPVLGTCTSASSQIVFVDSAVPDSEVLVRALSGSGKFEGQVVYLDGNRNGVEQIAEVLANYRNLEAIHILSHGASGSLLLGNTLLDARTIQDYADQLRDWGVALAEEGDLLLYGCDVAEGAAGVGFLNDLSALTGADIAASDDLTGSTALQGDWDLEYRRGTIEAIPAFSASGPEGYAHVLWFTVVALPDTQEYAHQQLQGAYDQTQWIADHAASENIALVSQLGDLVEHGALYEDQWVWMDGAMDILDGTSIPYSVLPGNHDFDVQDSHTTINRFVGRDAAGNVDPALADLSFGPSRYAGQSWFVGASDDEHNYAQIFTADGQEYLHIALEWLPRASAVAWAQQQIDAHPDLPVILSTHTYLSAALGGRTTAGGTDAYSGEQLFQALVYPNPQVFMVLSAHDTEYHQVSIDAAGFEVLEMMDDYSTRPNGGDGWMQFVTLDPALNRVDVKTYSPSLDQFEVDAMSQFSFDLDFQERFNFLQAPMAALVNPLDQGPDDLNPAHDAVMVNTTQSHLQIQLTDANDGVDHATVTSQTAAITKDGVLLTESVDYSFSYDPLTGLISLTPAGDSFGNGLYEIVLNGGAAKIADLGGNALATTTLVVRIDTSIPVPQAVTFQEGVNGYTGTLDTDVWGDFPDNEYSASPSVRVDGVATILPIQALLRFENIFGTGPGQIPPGAQIASAQLELNVTDNGNALSLYRMLRHWAETETWNTLGAGIQTDDIEALDTPDASTDYIAAAGVLSIDVTASLQAWANAPAMNFGWAISQGSGTNRVLFDSSEGTTPPKLIVTFLAPFDNEPPTVALANATTSLAENTNTTPRLKVADIVITDDFLGVNDLSLGGADAALFEIEGLALYLKAGTVLDRQTNPVLDVTVAVDDATVGGTPDDTAALAIAVTDVNVPPVVTLANATTSLAENTSTTPRLKVADIVITDDVFGVNDLSLGGADAALFEIDGSELYLKAGTVLDYETHPVLDVTIAVDDAMVGGSPDSTAALAIAVTDVNEAPALALANVTTSLPENTSTAVRLKVADIVITDDVLGVNDLSLSGADAALFEIDGSALYLQAGTVLDYETHPVLEVAVAVDDATVGGSPDGTAALAIAVTDVYEAPTAALVSPMDQGPEDLNPASDEVTVNTVQPHFQIQLADANDDVDDATVTSQTVAITKDGVLLSESVDYLFSYDPVTDRISLTPAGGSFGNGLYDIVLSGGEARIVDLGGNALVTTTFAVRIDTSIPVPQTVTFQEGVNGYAGTLDTDVWGDLPDNEYSTSISVRVDGVATVYPIEGLLRFESIFGSGPGQIPVGAPIASARLELNITDIGNALMFYRMLRHWVQTETWNTLGAGIQTDGIEAVSLPDVSTDFIAAAGVLSIDVTASLQAWANAPEANFGWAILQGSGTNRVLFDSSEGTTPPKLIVTFLAPLANQPPTVALANTTTSLAENVDTTTRLKVADIVVTDDALGVNDLSLSGEDAALFEIDGLALYLKASTILDYETNPVLDVTVAVDDVTIGASPDGTAALAVAVTDVNEAPTVMLVNATTTLPEDTNTTVRLKVADIVVTDDALGVNNLSLAGPEAALFETDGAALYLKAGAILDYETNPVLDVTVAVDDATVGGTPDGTAALAISVTFVGVPEITVLGNGVSIGDGDMTPSLADHTDFGSVVQGGTAINRTFTVRNDGTTTLTLGAVTVPAGFTLTEGLATSLAPGASDTFTVRLDTATVGTKTGDISLVTDDSDENPFNFRITGAVTLSTVNLAWGRPAVASTSYSGYPAANVTDGNINSRWSSQFSDNEWIYVDLGSAYTVGRVVLNWQVAYGQSYKIQVSNDASTWSDVYSTTTGDGGVDDITLATPATGRYVRMLGTQRGTPWGYSLFEVEVYGGPGVNHAPVVSSFGKSGTQDLALALAAGDFVGAFADPDAGDSLQKVKIISLPGHGVLTLGSTPVTVNQEVPVAQIGALTYTPAGGYTGSDSFQWNGSDGSLYAVSAAAVNLSINAAAANLALGRPAVASTSYSGYPASNVTDGNRNSRWSSEFSDNQWIYVDLGKVATVQRVVLNWQVAYGQSYKIQVSNDASTWSDVYSTTTGDGGVDDMTLATPATGRYVRMLGTQRGTQWGYSLFEFEVYSGPGVNHAPVVSSFGKTGTQDLALVLAAGDFAGAFADPDAGDSLQKVKIISLPGHGVLTLGSTPVTVNQEVPVAQIGALTYTPAGGYTGFDSFQWNGSDGSLYAVSAAAVNLSINAATANLAWGRPAVASTSYSGYPATNVTDGNINSRWSSEFSDNQWIYVDLGKVATVQRVVLNWQVAYGQSYKIQVSNDASTWLDVYNTTTGDGGVDDITLATPATGRYVRMLGVLRGTSWGYSLFEFEVYA